MPSSGDLGRKHLSEVRLSPVRLQLDAAQPLRLDQLSGGFVVRGGHADLFAVDIDAAGQLGVRRHVARIADGEVVLPVSATATLAMILVGSLDAQLESLPRDPTHAVVDAAELRDVEQWIATIGTAVFGGVIGWSDVATEAGTALELAAGEMIRGARAVRWVGVESGALRIAASDRLVPAGSAPAPIVGGMSLTAATPVRARFLGSASVAERGQITAGLELFHQAMMAALAERSRRLDQDAAARLDARAAVNLHGMADALDELATVIGARPRPAQASAAQPALVSVFARVCEKLEVPFPGDIAIETALSPAALARKAGIGYRDVLLRDNWWRQDNGPLIGQCYETKDPVALLPEAGSRYRMIDPANGVECLVDAAVAATIAPGASMLYRALPQAVDGLLPLLGFAVSGSRHDLLQVLAVGLAGGFLAAFMPIATGILFDSVIPHAETSQIVAIVVALIAVALGAAVFDLTRGVALLRIEARTEALLQPALMLRLLALPVRFFRDYGSGDLLDRVLAVPRIRRLVTGTTIVSALSLLMSLASFVVILFYSPVLALLSLALMVAGLVLAATLAYGQLRPQRHAASLGGRENALVVQMLQGIVKLRTSASEARMFAVWSRLFARKKTSELQSQRWVNGRSVFMVTFPTLASMLLFLAASAQTGGGGLSLGGFVAVNAAFGQLLAAMSGMVGALTGLLEAVPLVERVRPLLRTPVETHGSKADPGPLTGPIEISHVSFRYGPEDPLVIDNLSLRIDPGEFVAIVGASGSGKSTLMRLLLGFDTPDSGDIFYQNQAIASLDLAALRRRIGVVLQNGRTMTGNVFENMTNGLPYSLDEAWEAARMAGLAADIEALPMGMHTQLMEGSPALSGGQTQRLMIARALIGRPDVLMFDEATSALDNRSQAIVTASLSKLGATRIVIAHRLSTVQSADRIVVLDHGRIVEEGPFAVLMAREGALHALARRQQL